MTARFECDKCLKVFKRKENLNYHIKNNVCYVENAVENDKYLCKYCGRSFTSSTNMYRHIRYVCKIKKNEDSKREDIFEEKIKQLEERQKEMEKKHKKIEKEKDELKKEVIALKKNTNSTKNNIKTQNNTTNKGIVINGNVTLVGYGKEDLSKLDKSELLKILQHGFNSTIKLTEAVHFNPKYPEYHNVYISNMKDKYAMTFDGKDWNLTMKDDLINKIYDDKKNYIEENLDEFIDSLSIARKKALDRWLETDDDDEKISSIKDEIKLLLYNKREMALDKQKEIVSNVKLLKRVGSSSSKKVPKDEVFVDE